MKSKTVLNPVKGHVQRAVVVYEGVVIEGPLLVDSERLPVPRKGFLVVLTEQTAEAQTGDLFEEGLFVRPS